MGGAFYLPLLYFLGWLGALDEYWDAAITAGITITIDTVSEELLVILQGSQPPSKPRRSHRITVDLQTTEVNPPGENAYFGDGLYGIIPLWSPFCPQI